MLQNDAALPRPVNERNGAREHPREENKVGLPLNLVFESFRCLFWGEREGEEHEIRVKPSPAKHHCCHSGRSLTSLSVSSQTPPLPPPSGLSHWGAQEERPDPHCPPPTQQVGGDVKKRRDVPPSVTQKRLSKPQRLLASIKERVWPGWSGRWLKRIGWRRTLERGLVPFLHPLGGAESRAGCRCWGAWTCGPQSGRNEPSHPDWVWSWVWDRRRAHRVCTRVQVLTSSTPRETGRCLPGLPPSANYPSQPSQICPLWGNANITTNHSLVYKITALRTNLNGDGSMLVIRWEKKKKTWKMNKAEHKCFRHQVKMIGWGKWWESSLVNSSHANRKEGKLTLQTNAVSSMPGRTECIKEKRKLKRVRDWWVIQGSGLVAFYPMDEKQNY